MKLEFCQEHFSREQTDVVSLLALASSVVSLFGSSYMLLSYFLFSTRRNPLSKLVACLALADYLVSINNITKTSVIYFDHELYVWPLCVCMRVIFQTCAGATVGYATCIAFFLWRSLWFHKTRLSSCEWAMIHGLSWGVPLGCVLGLVYGDLLAQSPDLHLCFPKKPWHVILWFGPVMACFVVNLLFYLMVVYRIRKVKLDHQQERSEKLSKVIVRFSFYLLVFFLCWVFDVVTYVINTIHPSCNIFVFTVTYSVLLNLQGGLDFLVYGVTNDNIYRRFTTKATVLHSLFEFLLAPALVFPAFLVYARKVLHARRTARSLYAAHRLLSPGLNDAMPYNYSGHLQQHPLHHHLHDRDHIQRSIYRAELSYEESVVSSAHNSSRRNINGDPAALAAAAGAPFGETMGQLAPPKPSAHDDDDGVLEEDFEEGHTPVFSAFSVSGPKADAICINHGSLRCQIPRDSA